MQSDFASIIDPIFVAALRLESRIENRENIVTADERSTLIRKIEEAEAKLGTGEEWNLSKYAICAWIDARLIEANWESRNWWIEYCLEHRFFGTRDAKEKFFEKGIAAGKLSSKNALEVFYIAVVLGFRGFYTDGDLHYRRDRAQTLKIPDTIEGWCREVVRTLHFRQNKPTIPGIIQTGSSAKPLNGKAMLILYSMLGTLLVAFAIACYIFLFVGPS